MSSEDQWPIHELEDLCSQVTVGYVGSMTAEYRPTGIPFLRSQNVEPFRINLQDLRFIHAAFHEKISKSRLTPGDVVVVRTGTPGIAAVIPDWLEEANCSDLVVIRPNPHVLDPRFLAYAINSVVQSHIQSRLVGAVQQHFNVGSAKRMPIPLPPLPEQKAIAEVLGALDDKIELNRRMNHTLEEMASALFRSWFVDFDPVVAKADGRAPFGMDAATAALFPDAFVESEEGPIPEGWTWSTIGSVATLNPENWRASDAPDVITYLDLSNVDRGRIGELREVPFAEAPSRARRRLQDGDTIFGTVRPGNRAYALVLDPVDNLTGSTGFAVLRPNRGAWRSLIYLAVTQRESVETLAAVAEGSAYPAVNPSFVADTVIAKPPTTVAEAFEREAGSHLALCHHAIEQSRTLAALRDTLLPQLLSGTIRLSDAERLVGEA